MTDPVDLCRIDTTRNMRRFYHMSVQPGLFGDVAFIRQWGRIGTRGQRMEEWFEDEAAAEAACDKLTKQKQRRGYQSVL